ncbi:hypothetical protein FRC09_004300 [Ceratobasidium sp. 395]|nr:hypothetical protein FRC09_004300 [Ceratobasidium sp. 395]
MSNSLLFKSIKKTKSSREYRVGVSPYGTASGSQSRRAKQTLLLSSSTSVSERAMDRRAETVQKEYDKLMKSCTDARRKELQAIRDEIGWGNESTTVDDLLSEPLLLQDDDNDGTWVDELDDVFHAYTVLVSRQGRRTQSWAERLARERIAWEENMRDICDGFLLYSRIGAPSMPESTAASTSTSPVTPFSILCICLTEKFSRTFTPNTANEAVAVTLIRHGFIPTTPTSPSCAIHVDVLRYCAAFRRHGSVSLQAIATAICEVHNTVYARHSRTRLSAAFDVYQAIVRMVDSRIAKALRRDDPNWRMENACTACTYDLKDEPKLKYSKMFTCDGNNSLKRLANASTVDQRVLKDDYFLAPEYVDRFEDEVVNSRQKAKSKATEKTSIPAQNKAPKPSDSTQGENTAQDSSQDKPEPAIDEAEHKDIPCEMRWKNARADEAGKKVALFDETGIFAVACRHGTVMFVEDMRQSGELAKYGLAAVDKLCRVFGNDILLGYDIGCTFCGTVHRSPLVGPVAKECNMCFCTGSFHGYAHNRKCQLKNHPVYLEGAGSECFEECETLFSFTNATASSTRHASQFHRRQLIALRLSGWDFGRRCALGSVLKLRYDRALQTINTLPGEIEGLCPGKTDKYWLEMYNAERKYLESLKLPNPESNFAVCYLRKLRVLAEKQAAQKKAFDINIVYTHSSDIDQYRNQPGVKGTKQADQYQHKLAAETRKLEAKRSAASEQLMVVMEEVAKMEAEAGITERWTPGCPEWEAAVEREGLEDYHDALRDLELLIVQRIAELDKAHSAGTAYRSRTRMAKEINRREKAAHNALDRYNAIATRLKPPRPALEFNELTEHAYLAHFDFLRYSEHGATEAEWSRPTIRHCTEAWQKVQRAKEEIIRLNVEIRRIVTHMRDEEAFLAQQYDSIRTTEPDLACALHARMELAVRVNQRIRRDLKSISELEGFTGSLDCGTAVKPIGGTESCTVTAMAVSTESDGIPNTSNTLEALGDIHQDEVAARVETPEIEPSDEMQSTMIAMEEKCTLM